MFLSSEFTHTHAHMCTHAHIHNARFPAQVVPPGDPRCSMLQTDKVKLTWRDRFPAYFTNLMSIVFMVSSGRPRREDTGEPTPGPGSAITVAGVCSWDGAPGMGRSEVPRGPQGRSACPGVGERISQSPRCTSLIVTARPRSHRYYLRQN